MIVKDHRLASLIRSSIFAFAGISALAAPVAARAEQPAPLGENAPVLAPIAVTLEQNGAEASFTTHAKNVGELLAERGLQVQPGDYVSANTDQPLSEGAHISYRPAVPVAIEIGKQVRYVRSAAPTIVALLAEQGIALDAADEVSPQPSDTTMANEVIRVVRVSSWTSHVTSHLKPQVQKRFDKTLARGVTRTLASGTPGIEEVTLRFVKRGDSAPIRTVLASRIVRAPRAKIIVLGLARYDSLARFARQGFSSAEHFAGSALRMLATAYTAGCAGCTGITASGFRAGFGIIAVDPSVIPLGTKLYIPGYGRALAGDTGGAINGRRIDLGFNSYVEAMRWGSRAVNVYVLR